MIEFNGSLFGVSEDWTIRIDPQAPLKWSATADLHVTDCFATPEELIADMKAMDAAIFGPDEQAHHNH